MRKYPRFRNTSVPSTGTGKVILFDSTTRCVQTPSTGDTAADVGPFRGLCSAWRFAGQTDCTTENVTVEMDYLENGAWANVSAASVTVTAGTVAKWDLEPEAPDYRIYIKGSGTAPSAHETTFYAHGDLEA